jgi:dCTP deaminase
MILSDVGIKQAIARGHVTIDPAPQADHYQTSAVDILLGESFKVWNIALLKGTDGFTGTLDLSQQKFSITAQKFAQDADLEKDGSFILKPYQDVPQVLLCQTEGRLSLDPRSLLAARVEGRSSLARLGVMVHLTAPTIHAGFNGFITLEVINHGPFDLKLVPHKTIMCQYIFERLEQKPGMKISSSFVGQDTPTGKSTKVRARTATA